MEGNSRQGDRKAQGGTSLVGDAAKKPQRPRSAPRASRWVLQGWDIRPALSGEVRVTPNSSLLLSAWQGAESMLFLRNHLVIHSVNIY